MYIPLRFSAGYGSVRDVSAGPLIGAHIPHSQSLVAAPLRQFASPIGTLQRSAAQRAASPVVYHRSSAPLSAYSSECFYRCGYAHEDIKLMYGSWVLGREGGSTYWNCLDRREVFESLRLSNDFSTGSGGRFRIRVQLGPSEPLTMGGQRSQLLYYFDSTVPVFQTSIRHLGCSCDH